MATSSISNGKQRKKSDDAAVIGTNDAAFMSKIKAMEIGYFSDKYLQSMKQQYDHLQSPLINAIGTQNQTAQTGQPVMNRGAFARVLIKDRLIQAWLSKQQQHNDVQILSLGAGFDTSLFRVMEQWKQTYRHGRFLNVVELDLQPVVNAKRRLGKNFLQSNDTTTNFTSLFNMVNELEHDDGITCEITTSDSKVCCRYTLLSCDLRNIQYLTDLLNTASVINKRNATLIISEISLVYLQVKYSDAIVQKLAQMLTNAQTTFLNMEPVTNGTEFGRLMAVNVAKRGSVLFGIQTYHDVQSQKTRFEHLGWGSCAAQTMLQLWELCLTVSETGSSLQKVEFLDELEEFHLLLEHYCVVVACRCRDDGLNLLLSSSALSSRR